MKRATVVVSFVIHAGVAVSLMGAAQQGERRKAISVAVADAKKKAPPPRPPPPPPVVHRAPRVVASVPAHTAPAPVAAPKAAPSRAVETALAMSNDDAPGGIALAPRGAAAAAAPTRVASAVSAARTRRTREALGDASGAGETGGAGEAPCTEEPSKPVPVSRTDLEYTVAAKTEGIEGKLKLKLTVAADGSVSDVEVLASVEPALDQVAVAAARQWRFRPAMLCGRAVAGGTYVLQKRYELTD